MLRLDSSFRQTLCIIVDKLKPIDHSTADHMNCQEKLGAVDLDLTVVVYVDSLSQQWTWHVAADGAATAGDVQDGLFSGRADWTAIQPTEVCFVCGGLYRCFYIEVYWIMGVLVRCTCGTAHVCLRFLFIKDAILDSDRVWQLTLFRNSLLKTRVTKVIGRGWR